MQKSACLKCLLILDLCFSTLQQYTIIYSQMLRLFYLKFALEIFLMSIHFRRLCYLMRKIKTKFAVWFCIPIYSKFHWYLLLSGTKYFRFSKNILCPQGVPAHIGVVPSCYDRRWNNEPQPCLRWSAPTFSF